LLGSVGIFVVLGVIGYFTIQARADRALKTDGLLEALRMLSIGGMDAEVIKMLGAQLPKWPITDEIKSAVGELQGLKTGLDAAAKAGVSQTLVAAFKQDTLKALDQMWHLAERVAGAGAQKVEYESLEGQASPYVEQVRRVRSAAKQARLAMARLALTDRDASGTALDEASEGLRVLSDAVSEIHGLEMQQWGASADEGARTDTMGTDDRGDRAKAEPDGSQPS
jgi:hypothetical protein